VACCGAQLTSAPGTTFVALIRHDLLSHKGSSTAFNRPSISYQFRLNFHKAFIASMLAWLEIIKLIGARNR
jgi:hypothetical protein